jgi:hypothetical protein
VPPGVESVAKRMGQRVTMDHLERRQVLGALAGCSHSRSARHLRRATRYALAHGDPHVPIGSLFLRCSLAAVSAFVALVFFSPLLALWLAVYLVLIFGLAPRAAPRSISTTCRHRRGASAVGPLRSRWGRPCRRRLARSHLPVRRAREALANQGVHLETVHRRHTCLVAAPCRCEPDPY